MEVGESWKMQYFTMSCALLCVDLQGQRASSVPKQISHLNQPPLRGRRLAPMLPMSFICSAVITGKTQYIDHQHRLGIHVHVCEYVHVCGREKEGVSMVSGGRICEWQLHVCVLYTCVRVCVCRWVSVVPGGCICGWYKCVHLSLCVRKIKIQCCMRFYIKHFEGPFIECDPFTVSATRQWSKMFLWLLI